MVTSSQAADLMREAIALQEHGHHREAFEIYARILVAYPKHPDVLHNAGLAKLALEDFNAAEELLLSAVALRPAFDRARSNLVKLWTQMVHAGRDRAGTLHDIAEDPVWTSALDFDAGLALGQYFLHRGLHHYCHGLFARCVVVRPDDPTARHLLGIAFHRLDLVEEAERELREALRHAPDNAVLLSDLAGCLFALHAKTKRRSYLDDGHALLARAVARDPKNAHVQHQIGLIHEEGGAFEKAAKAYTAALAAAPNYLPAVTSLVSASRGRVPPDLESTLARVLESSGAAYPASEIARAHRALGKCHDARDEVDQAFAHFTQANAATPNPRPYDRARHEAYVTNLMAAYTAATVRGLPRAAGPSRPVFIVGMPRSGTTLLEHVLASHPEIAGAGELSFFLSLEFSGRAPHDHTGRVRADWAKKTAAENLDSLRRDFDGILAAVDPSTRYVIDKMPFNAWQVGLIAALYPDAPILHCVRDRYDIGLSCFIESFTELHAWSLDLADIGHYYGQYERIMRHWRAQFGARILDVNYADMVADHESTVRQVLDFLDLPWSDAIAGYNARARSIQTPSNWQVRQPIYRSSLERWRKYSAHLQPLFAALP